MEDRRKAGSRFGNEKWSSSSEEIDGPHQKPPKVEQERLIQDEGEVTSSSSGNWLSRIFSSVKGRSASFGALLGDW